MPIGGSKFELEKTWRATGVGTQTFNAPGTFTMNYGKQNIYVSGTGGTGSGGNPATYNTTPGTAATYNSTTPATYNKTPGTANYNTVAGTGATYNPPTYPTATYNPRTVATYNPPTYPTATYNPRTVSSYNPPVDTYNTYSSTTTATYDQFSYSQTVATYNVFYAKYGYTFGTGTVSSSFLNQSYGSYGEAGTGTYQIQSGTYSGTVCYVLNRAPDESGLKYWLDQIQAGTAFNTVLDNFFTAILGTLSLASDNIYQDYRKATTGSRTISVKAYTADFATSAFFIDTLTYPSYPGQSTAYTTYNTGTGPASPYTAPTTNYSTTTSYVPFYYQTQTDYRTYTVTHVTYYSPGTANYNPGNAATYNTVAGTAATYNAGTPATYNTVAGTAATYNSPTYPIANYNPPTYPTATYNPTTVATYNPPTYPVATYSAWVAGNASSALGVSLPGGPGGNQPVPATPNTEISYYSYPDNASYPVTVATGGQVIIITK
jgi:hypothetical protein